MNNDLPEELVVEIMSWLPPQSVIQSKAVSKKWKSLITSLSNDSNFIAKHLRNQTASSVAVVLTCQRHRRELFSLLTLSGVSAETELLNLPIIADEKGTTSVAVSGCNGLICLADRFHHAMLLNPALNKFRSLPPPILGADDHFALHAVGFGHHSRADDYKLVRFGRDNSAARNRAEVYSLRADAWREIHAPAEEDEDNRSLPCMNAEVSSGERFYWLMTAGQGQRRKYEVRWFDMSKEEFGSVAVPECVDVAEANWVRMSVRKGRMTFVLRVGERVEVWGMEEEDEGGAWREVARVEHAQEVDCPLAFWKEDELLLRGSSLKDVVSYNIRTQYLRHVGVDGVDGVGSRAFTYVKSLVPL